jgi:Domain of unknown function (DUF4082)
VTDYRVFPATDGPPDSVSDGQPLNLAMEIRTTGQTWVTALHFWRGTTAITGTIVGRLYTVDTVSTGTPVPGTDVTFTLSGTGWQTATLDAPVELSPDVRHKVVVRYADQFPITGAYWSSGAGASGHVNGPLQAYSDATAVAGQGTFSAGSFDVYPTSSVNAANYWVDLTVTDTDPNTGGPVDLDGSTSAATSAVGALTVTRTLGGVSSGADGSDGDLGATRDLSGAPVAASSATGTLTAARTLQGVTASASTATAALTVTNPLALPDETFTAGRLTSSWRAGRLTDSWSAGRLDT